MSARIVLFLFLSPIPSPPPLSVCVSVSIVHVFFGIVLFEISIWVEEQHLCIDDCTDDADCCLLN